MELMIISSVITGLTVSIVSGILMALLKRNWDKNDAKQAEIEKLKTEIAMLRKCVWRLNKTVLIFGKTADDQIKKLHPELTSNLEDIASELLESDID